MCTFEKFPFKVSFYYIDRVKNAKIRDMMDNFWKKDFDFIIFMIKYTFYSFTLFSCKYRKIQKNSIWFLIWGSFGGVLGIENQFDSIEHSIFL